MRTIVSILVGAVLLSACSGVPAPDVASTLGGTKNSGTVGSMAGMLEAHNLVRKKHGLTDLRWSGKLASYATEWAQFLAQNNACNMKHRSTQSLSANNAGENIFWASDMNWSDGRLEAQKLSARDVVRSWAEEEQFYNYVNNSCASGQQCGHYTQLVWKDTQEVGCGFSLCPGQKQIWVCNYSPAGNVVGRKPY